MASTGFGVSGCLESIRSLMAIPTVAAPIFKESYVRHMAACGFRAVSPHFVRLQEVSSSQQGKSDMKESILETLLDPTEPDGYLSKLRPPKPKASTPEDHRRLDPKHPFSYFSPQPQTHPCTDSLCATQGPPFVLSRQRTCSRAQQGEVKILVKVSSEVS